MGRACSTYGEKGNAYRILMGKPEGNIPLGSSVNITVTCILSLPRVFMKTDSVPPSLTL
jgi:hypothetical protein